MSNGPLPTTRCLLSSLPSCQVGDKVRFLGCVQAYSTKTAELTLEHRFPPSTTVRAVVDVKLVLPTLDVSKTDIGAWVHVIGYVTAHSEGKSRLAGGSARKKVGVQALVVWTAEDLLIDEYEISFVDERD